MTSYRIADRWSGSSDPSPYRRPAGDLAWRRSRLRLDRDDRNDHSPQERRFSSLLIVFLITLLGATLAFVATRTGALDALLPRVVDQERIEPASEASAPENELGATSAGEPIARPRMPDVAGLGVLVRNTIVALDQADATNNYSILREMAAPRFQAANSPARLSELFAKLRGQNLDLDSILTVSPVLHGAPTIDDQGMLRLSGSFAATTGPVEFDLVFEMVESRWRLFGIGVKPMGIAQAKPVPADPSTLDHSTLVLLIRSHITALNQGNLTSNYSVLRDLSAPGFQQANSLAKLTTIFAELRGRQLDLGPVAVINPELSHEAAIDHKGMLRLRGFFPTKPERVTFDMTFQVIQGQWRLFDLVINATREVAASVLEQEDASATDSGTPETSMPPPIPRLRPQS